MNFSNFEFRISDLASLIKKQLASLIKKQFVLDVTKGILPVPGGILRRFAGSICAIIAYLAAGEAPQNDRHFWELRIGLVLIKVDSYS
jgi:hypothetical protein